MQIFNDKLFRNPIEIIEVFDSAELKQATEKLDKYKEKYYLLGYIRYEAKEAFLGNNLTTKKPLLYFEVYENYEKISTKTKDLTEAKIFIKDVIKKEEYINNINKIKELIENGITYEVNYTYPSKVYTNVTDTDLFNFLRNRQNTEFCTFIKNKYETVLSFSPELFFKIKGNKILTKPMKGTIKRGKTFFEDRKNCLFLRNDEKNRSENLMIVDLLRNDTARFSKPKTVKVEKLFKIEKYKTVYQMVSEISAKLNDNTTLWQILSGLFPCGSITGAPKISTMKVIDEIENYEREIYCGAIGYLSPKECIFSVPIRILQKNAESNYYKYAAGGAIVWDSKEEEEFEETLVKRSFLETDTKFSLIETMKAENGKIFLFEEHLERLKNSCKFFNFVFPKELENFIPQQNGIVRLLVQKDGTYSTEYKPIKDITTTEIKIAEDIMFSENIFLWHKTTIREHYKKTSDLIKKGLYFDKIYFNEKGELTEGSRSNVIIKQNGILYTPPVFCGLLNGTYRKHLLKQGKIFEKTMYLDDVLNAEEIYCINSIRGMVKTDLICL